MRLPWTRIILTAVAWTGLSAMAGSAYQCIGPDGAVTLGDACPPGTQDSRYLGETSLPPDATRDAYNPYSVMEQVRRLDAQHALERQAEAERRAQAARRQAGATAPEPEPEPETEPPTVQSGFGTDGYPVYGGSDSPAPRRPSPPGGPGYQPLPNPRHQGSGHAIHPESAGSNIRPGHRAGIADWPTPRQTWSNPPNNPVPHNSGRWP